MAKVLDYFSTLGQFEDCLFNADYAAATIEDGDFTDDLLNRLEDDGGEDMILTADEAHRLRRIAAGAPTIWGDYSHA